MQIAPWTWKGTLASVRGSGVVTIHLPRLIYRSIN